MTNINNELSDLLGDIFFEVSNNTNEYIPIIRNSNNISKIIPYFLIDQKDNERENYSIYLIQYLTELFKINNNIIPLFMRNSNNFNGTSFYESLITLYLEDYRNGENKLVIEELMQLININYPLSKKTIEFIYQNLSKYFTNDSTNRLTLDLLNRYLNCLSLMYSEPSSFLKDKDKKIIKKYIFFNGINSRLSFILNKDSCNNYSGFPTIEKGFSLVFWVKLDYELIKYYFKILDEKIDINLIKINIGGELLVVKLVNPKSIVISTKDFSTKNIDINKIFKYDEWNNIIFVLERKKNKLITKLHINNNQIDNDINFKNRINWNEKINNIDLFENFLGKISSIIFFSFIIDYSLIEYFSNINGFYKDIILKEFLILVNRDYLDTNANIEYNKDKKLNLKLSNELKIKLKEQTPNNLISCFCPFTYDKNNNSIDDVFGNFIAKLGNNDGVNNYKNKSKNVVALGGINNLLPIMELMFSSLKKDNPYKLIDNNIFNEKNFHEFLIIIQKIFFTDRSNFYDEKEIQFLSSLSLFLEKTPSKLFSLKILQNIINIIIILIQNEQIITLKKSSNFINLILLNERIIMKFNFNVQLELWNNLNDILIKDLKLIKESLNTSKVCVILRMMDENRYTQFCCLKHARLINAKISEKNKEILMKPLLNVRINRLFEIIQFYIDHVEEDNNFTDLFKLLSLDLSPCIQNKILDLYISHFTNEKVNPKIKNKTLTNLLKNKFIVICEYILKISLLDTRLYIFRLFILLISDYKNNIYDHFRNNSLIISSIVDFFCLNILPNNIILEIDNETGYNFRNKNNNLLLDKGKIDEINKKYGNDFLKKYKKYAYLEELLNKEEYKKNLEVLWNFFLSSLKFVPKEWKNGKIITKNKKALINPFVLNFLINFVTKTSFFYLAQFLIEILSCLKDDLIINRNIFYYSKQFFPWLIDTIFYFHFKKNESLLGDKDLSKTIKLMSIKILCELFSHKREKAENLKKLRIIMEYAYYFKKRNNVEINEIIDITRLILTKICQNPEVQIDIKSKILFEFIVLFKNSEDIFEEETYTLKEINTFYEKDFFENNSIYKNESNNWEALINNNINNNKINEISESIKIEENMDKEDDEIKVIENNNEIESPNKVKYFSSKEIKHIGKIDLIPNYFYEGINYLNDDEKNKNKKLENIWNDYNLFINIKEYYKAELWGLKSLCKNIKNLKSYKEGDDLSKVIKELYKFYGDTKENKNVLVKKFLKYISFDNPKKKDINTFYLNIILLNIAIDITENENEKTNLYSDYQQFLLFFVLISINISPNAEIKDKLNRKINSDIKNFLYYIIGYGFSFIKNRDPDIFEKFINNLIKPIFQINSRNIFGYSKKYFFSDSIIGKLFTLKDNMINDDTNLSISFKGRNKIKKHIRAATDLSRSQVYFEDNKGGELKLSRIKDNSAEIVLRENSSMIINEIIEETINTYKYEKSNISKSPIFIFYEDDIDNSTSDIVANKEMKIRMEEYERNIGKNINKIIKNIKNEIKQYLSMSCLMQLRKRRHYKKVKKILFSWNGFWSDRKLFYKHPEYLKYHIKNHFTNDMTKVLLSPILDVDYYLPEFKTFYKNKIFNKDDYKYMIKLNVNEILSLDEEENIKVSNEIIINNSKKNNININKEKLNEKVDNNKNKIKEDIKKKIFKNGIKHPINSKNGNEIIIKKIFCPCIILTKSKKDFFYLKSLFKYSFKGIWEQLQNFPDSKLYFRNVILGNKDTFDILVQSRLMSLEECSKYENIYNCCIVKPTHHITGYISTEKKGIKFTHCAEDKESLKFLENDINYDKELHCCFGAIFKKHIKDTEKVSMEIFYNDIKYILLRNYFYQETAIEIYTYSNKSYFFNFKTNNEMKKFRDDILKHETFIAILGKDLKGKKTLGYQKSNSLKTKPQKIKYIMKDWMNNDISTLKYLMYLNIFSGRSFNDLTQYPVLPWLIINYKKEELSKDDYRDLSIPMGMIDVSDKSITRKETFLEFYETLKADFNEANREFNYKEFLNKGGEYLEQYKLKRNKKRKGNHDETDVNDNNINKIEINQIPFFYGTHYSCPTYVSHFLMRVFPFSLISIEIHGNKFDDPDRIFMSLQKTFETASSLKEDIRELIPEFYSLPEMMLNKNNLNLTQDKLDSEGKEIIINNVELPLWCNNLSYYFTSELRKTLETNELKINKWIDLIFGYLQRGEKAEEHHNLFMAQSYENMVKIENITDEEERNALMRLVEVGITPKQIFPKESEQRNERIVRKWKYLYESKKLITISITIPNYADFSVKKNAKLINDEQKVMNVPKCLKLKCIGYNEIILLDELNYIYKFKFKNTVDKSVIDEKQNYHTMNISSEFTPAYKMSSQKSPIIIYNNNKYMIKSGFWDGRIEVNTLGLDSKEKIYYKKNIYVNEGPIIVMEITKDENILLCGTKIGCIICFSVHELSLKLIKKLNCHYDEITSININDNLNMFATSSLDGYINLHTLPSFELVHSIQICNININSYLENDLNIDYANNIFLSSSPLPCIAAYISTKRIFRTFTINGEFIEEIEETGNSNYIKCPIIFHDLNFQEYLIYATDDGIVKIRKFPNMELINSVSPGDGSEIVSLDISKDKKYCYIWTNNNKIFIIKDIYTDSEKDKKQINKIDKEEKEEEDNE